MRGKAAVYYTFIRKLQDTDPEFQWNSVYTICTKKYNKNKRDIGIT